MLEIKKQMMKNKLKMTKMKRKLRIVLLLDHLETFSFQITTTWSRHTVFLND